MTENQRIEKLSLLMKVLDVAIRKQNEYAEQLNAQDNGDRPIYRTFRALMIEVIRERRKLE